MCLDHASAKGAFLKKMSHSPVNEGLNYGRRIKEKNVSRYTTANTSVCKKRSTTHISGLNINTFTLRKATDEKARTMC